MMWRRGKNNNHQISALLPFLPVLLLAQWSGSNRMTGCEDGAHVGNNGDSSTRANSSESSSKSAAPEIDEDCPFCRFFLDGPCRDEFVSWHACVQTSEEATDCMGPFRPLQACMEKNGLSFGGQEENDENSDEIS